jgi:hypothetical protein
MTIQEITYSCEYKNWQGKKLSHVDTALTTSPQGLIDKWNRQGYNGKYVYKLISTKEKVYCENYVRYSGTSHHYREVS